MLVEVSAIGLGTIESLPLFHYHPGRSAMRVLAEPSRWPSNPGLWCEGVFEICDWISMPHSYGSVKIPLDALIALARRWRVDCVAIEGIDSWRYVDIFDGIPASLVARYQGLAGDLPDSYGGVDALIIDYVDGFSGADAIRRALESVEDKVWVEVNIYVGVADSEKVSGIIESLGIGLGTPLHIHIGDPGGGGPVRVLQRRISKKHWPTYVHAGVYSWLDTLCPNCERYIATRSPWWLVSLNVERGKTGEFRCPSCGALIALKGIPALKTDPKLYAATGGSTVWYDPKALITSYNYGQHGLGQSELEFGED